MSERYEKLFSLQENLYAEGSPVVVSAGNLLKDTQTGKLLAQLKFKSLSPKPIKAARILLCALDTLGKPLGCETEKEYLDLAVRQGDEFGQKTAIPLANASTRGYTVRVKQVIFADNSTWEGADTAWEPLPAAESLLQKLGDKELVRQYRLKFGEKCEVMAREHKDLWLCACGTWNREEACYRCGKKKAALLSLELPALRAEKDARLAKEKADREAKEAAEKEAKEKSAKKTKKILSISIPAAVVLLAALLLVTKVLIPNSNYSKAKSLLDAGQYEEAITAFEALNGYKDSAEQIGIAKEAKLEAENAEAYAKAEALLEAEKYKEAARAFEALGGYKDSADQANSADLAFQYKRARMLTSDDNSANDEEAMRIFQELGDYEDAKSYLSHFAVRMLQADNITYQYDAAGELRSTSEGRMEAVGKYILVYTGNGSVHAYLKDYPACVAFRLNKIQTGEFRGYYNFDCSIPMRVPAQFAFKTADLSVKDSTITIMMKPSSYNIVVQIVFHEDGDVSYSYDNRDTGSEETKEFKLSIDGRAWTYTTERGGECSYDFDEFGLMKRSRDGLVSLMTYTITYNESGFPIKSTKPMVTGLYSEDGTTYVFGYVFAPEAKN